MYMCGPPKIADVHAKSCGIVNFGWGNSSFAKSIRFSVKA